MPKHDTNNNHNVENMNKVLANDHQLPKDDKRSGSVRSFQLDKFNQSQPNYDSGNYANQQQQPPQQPQQMQQQTNANESNSKFMSFFARDRNSSSSSLNEFFKQAMNQGHGSNPEQPKPAAHMNQMPSGTGDHHCWAERALPLQGPGSHSQTHRCSCRQAFPNHGT